MFASHQPPAKRLGARSLTAALLTALLSGCGVTAATPPTRAPATATLAQETTAVPAQAPTAALLPPPGGVMPGGSSATQATPAFPDLAYASLSGAQKLDLYLPEGAGPFPVIVTVHGGGFMMGDKADPMGTAGVDQLLAAGYAVAATNYRLSGEAQAPAQIQDIKAAVRWLRANASQYRLDGERIGAWGASAGGSLVALLGTSCGAAELAGAELGNAEQSSCVQAVVDWFGPTDFLLMDQQFAGTACPQTHDAADSPESQLLGAPLQSVPEKARQVNPITYVGADAPPFLIQHGTADCNVPPQQSQLLYDALVAAGGPERATLNLIEGAGHSGAQFMAAENMALVVAFFDAHLT